MNESYLLQILGTVTERFRQQDNWEFKITGIQLLSELRDKMAKSISIQVPLHDLNNQFVENLQHIIHRNQEEQEVKNCQLKFILLDYEDKVSLEMPAKGVKVCLSNEFLQELTALTG